MEFHEKLQELRRRKGLTQEDVAEELFVSRAAVSKWESGRGYPNIDSLKAIARFYGVTVDALLSGEELLTIAEKDRKDQESRFRDQVFGALDLCTLLYFFLPLFAERMGGVVHGVSLLSLTGVAGYMKAIYIGFVMAQTILGVLALTVRKPGHSVSLALNAAGVLLFSLSLQPYGAALCFVFLMIKVFLLIKNTDTKSISGVTGRFLNF